MKVKNLNFSLMPNKKQYLLNLQIYNSFHSNSILLYQCSAHKLIKIVLSLNKLLII